MRRSLPENRTWKMEKLSGGGSQKKSVANGGRALKEKLKKAVDWMRQKGGGGKKSKKKKRGLRWLGVVLEIGVHVNKAGQWEESPPPLGENVCRWGIGEEGLKLASARKFSRDAYRSRHSRSPSQRMTITKDIALRRRGGRKSPRRTL